jgi:thiamine-phosphate pyrophosphorylase
MKHHPLALTLVTHKNNQSSSDYLAFITQCAQSGISAVQLREKHLNSIDLKHFAQELKACLTPYHIPLIINDYVDLCLQIDADGVHLGQTDGEILHARQQLGPHKIIGLTIDNLTQLNAANHLPINYVGIGPIFPTRHKSNAPAVWGVEKLKQAALLSQHPIIAIGGIDGSNAQHVMQAGASGMAAIGAFHDTTETDDTICHLRQIINEARHAN